MMSLKDLLLSQIVLTSDIDFSFPIRLVAREMAKMHRLDPAKILDQEGKPRFNINKDVKLFSKMRKWLDIGPSSFDDPVRNER